MRAKRGKPVERRAGSSVRRSKYIPAGTFFRAANAAFFMLRRLRPYFERKFLRRCNIRAAYAIISDVKDGD